MKLVKFTKINLHQNNKICKHKKSKLWTNDNIEKWCKNIDNSNTENKIKIDTNKEDNIIEELQSLKL